MRSGSSVTRTSSSGTPCRSTRLVPGHADAAGHANASASRAARSQLNPSGQGQGKDCRVSPPAPFAVENRGSRTRPGRIPAARPLTASRTLRPELLDGLGAGTVSISSTEMTRDGGGRGRGHLGNLGDGAQFGLDLGGDQRLDAGRIRPPGKDGGDRGEDVGDGGVFLPPVLDTSADKGPADRITRSASHHKAWLTEEQRVHCPSLSPVPAQAGRGRREIGASSVHDPRAGWEARRAGTRDCRFAVDDLDRCRQGCGPPSGEVSKAITDQEPPRAFRAKAPSGAQNPGSFDRLVQATATTVSPRNGTSPPRAGHHGPTG